MNGDELIEKLEKTKSVLWKFEKRLLVSMKNLFVSLISYLFALWIYFWIYDNHGWERTLIAIGVGFIVFSLRERVSNNGQ
jgi:hypothetical protein